MDAVRCVAVLRAASFSPQHTATCGIRVYNTQDNAPYRNAKQRIASGMNEPLFGKCCQSRTPPHVSSLERDGMQPRYAHTVLHVYTSCISFLSGI